MFMVSQSEMTRPDEREVVNPSVRRHCLGIESLQFQSDRCIPYDNLVKLFIAEAGLANDLIVLIPFQA